MKNDLLNQLFTDKMNVIYRYLLKIGCNDHDAEDIIQDTFCKALIYIDGISTSKMSSWLFRVAINKYYDQCRRKNRYVHVSIDEGVLSNDALCEDYIVDLEKKKDILQTLNSLNETYKNLLMLKYDMDLSYKDIADVLDIKENTVKTYLFRAREQFKKYWRMIDNE